MKTKLWHKIPCVKKTKACICLIIIHLIFICRFSRLFKNLAWNYWELLKDTKTVYVVSVFPLPLPLYFSKIYSAWRVRLHYRRYNNILLLADLFLSCFLATPFMNIDIFISRINVHAHLFFSHFFPFCSFLFKVERLSIFLSFSTLE